MVPTARAPRVVCAWCGVELSAGAEPVSHGICDPCRRAWLARAGLGLDDDAEVVRNPAQV